VELQVLSEVLRRKNFRRNRASAIMCGVRGYGKVVLSTSMSTTDIEQAAFWQR
jgi:hypothetical protein